MRGYILPTYYFFEENWKCVGYSPLQLQVYSKSTKECHPHTIHSFINYGDLYSAPSRLPLRSAPDPCTAKKKSFETRVECVRKNPGKQSLRQRKPIDGGRPTDRATKGEGVC